MTPDEAIEKARWYEREDIATTLREEANVLADEVERLRERVARLEEALRDGIGRTVSADCKNMIGSGSERECWNCRARAALEETK